MQYFSFDGQFAAGKLRWQRLVKQGERVFALASAYKDLSLKKPEPPRPFCIVTGKQLIAPVRFGLGIWEVAAKKCLSRVVEGFLRVVWPAAPDGAEGREGQSENQQLELLIPWP
ncbi:MAG: hypothetical protein ACLP56_16995 [Candidatus Sulfotelmatobacter sp.]